MHRIAAQRAQAGRNRQRLGRRLVRARQLLLTGGPTTTVAGAARSVAMPHLGRFAGEYRERYGENPSETLLRAGGSAAGSAGIAGAS